MICRYKIKFISDIEQKIRKLLVNIAVAPFVGVWIEMDSKDVSTCGNNVAPFVGVWIEIAEEVSRSTAKKVAPFVGVWIEIFPDVLQNAYLARSLPSWECGLKLH